MTVDAPSHREGLHLADALHRLDGAVALLARHSVGDMRPVVEDDEVRQLMDTPPANRRRFEPGRGLERLVQAETPVQLASSGETTLAGSRPAASAADSSARTAVLGAAMKR